MRFNAELCQPERRNKMSGKYLHGLLIDGDFIDVRDNIFSHSELRKTMTKSEQKHPFIQEWSWDYVTRHFVETHKSIIPILQVWIHKNLSTHKQLISWVNRNWEGLVNGDEQEREMYIWELLLNPIHPDKLINRFLKADADWKKAYADWKKADADWKKADADRKKADADWEKADADRKKADEKWKTNILKPIFMGLLKKFPNANWREINEMSKNA